jgi:alcohol dehydrogenase
MEKIYKKENCDLIVAVGGESPMDCAKAVGIVASYVHSMAPQLGGLYDLPYGVCNAILLPYVEMYNKEVCPERFSDISRAMGEKIEGLSPEEAADKAIAAIKKLASDIGTPSGLKELGVREEDLELLEENAMQDVCRLTNPREFSKEDVIEIYRKAM